jgi:hypothetical protein
MLSFPKFAKKLPLNTIGKGNQTSSVLRTGVMCADKLQIQATNMCQLFVNLVSPK